MQLGKVNKNNICTITHCVAEHNFRDIMSDSCHESIFNIIKQRAYVRAGVRLRACISINQLPETRGSLPC